MEFVAFYFEVSRQAIKNYCMEDECPCNRCQLPDDQGYLYCKQYVISCRIHNRTNDRDALGVPKRICEIAAKKHKLNLDIAREDLKQWWLSGCVPLRETPFEGQTKGTYNETIPRVCRVKIEAMDIDLCKEKVKELYPEYEVVSEKTLRYTNELKELSARSNTVEDARKDIDANIPKNAILKSETIQLSKNGVLKGVSGESEAAVKRYLFRFEEHLRPSRQADKRLMKHIIENEPEAVFFYAKIDKYDCVVEPEKKLWGLISSPGIYNVHWKTPCEIKIEYYEPAAVEFILNPNGFPSFWQGKHKIGMTMNIDYKNDVLNIEEVWGEEANAVFRHLQITTNMAEFKLTLPLFKYTEFKSDLKENAPKYYFSYRSEWVDMSMMIKKFENKIRTFLYKDNITGRVLLLVDEDGELTCTRIK